MPEDSTNPAKLIVTKGRLQNGALLRVGLLRNAVPLAIGVACVGFGLAGGVAREWGEYEREAIEAAQWWRLFSAHLVHLGWGHLWLNLLALLLIALLLDGVLSTAEWLATALIAALAIDLGLYLWDNDVQWYVGLSGLLHGFLAAGALRLLARRSVLGVLLAVGLVAKLAWEQAAGPIPWTESGSGGPVVVAAHLYGAAAGLAVAAASRLLRRLAL
jgi:rhomboid family GlyGly-CTERM serine protease